MAPTTLRTERLVLRPWRADDRPPFAELNADPEVMEHFPRRLDREQSDAVADRIASRIDEQGWGLWAAEVPGVAPFIGFIGLQPVPADAPFAPAVEVGWRLARPHWGSGYATEGARAAVAFAFDDLVLDEVVSMTIPANERSQRVMRKLGLTYDPAGDFLHAGVPSVLYRLRREDRRV